MRRDNPKPLRKNRHGASGTIGEIDRGRPRNRLPAPKATDPGMTTKPCGSAKATTVMLRLGRTAPPDKPGRTQTGEADRDAADAQHRDSCQYRSIATRQEDQRRRANDSQRRTVAVAHAHRRTGLPASTTPPSIPTSAAPAGPGSPVAIFFSLPSVFSSLSHLQSIHLSHPSILPPPRLPPTPPIPIPLLVLSFPVFLTTPPRRCGGVVRNRAACGEWKRKDPKPRKTWAILVWEGDAATTRRRRVP